MSQPEIEFKMRCEKCKNIVRYALTKTHERYEVISKAIRHQHRFAFKDFCGFCDQKTGFVAAYFDENGMG